MSFWSLSLINPAPQPHFWMDFSCRDELSLLSLCWLGKRGWSLDCVLLEGFTHYLSNFTHLAFQWLFAFSWKIKETNCSSCCSRASLLRPESLPDPCLLYFSCHVENWWGKENCFKTSISSRKSSVMTPQWKMFPSTPQQRSHLMDHSQGFPLCNISLSLGQSPACQHSGIKSLKMAKLC